ncbi:MFS transporter [Pseudonocardia xishanensis]|uniref:MFS transporter n=1 Tax=Pseudonocardia xishanensis TaxID=630995 RepID=A0ABP8S358_9PSEU
MSTTQPPGAADSAALERSTIRAVSRRVLPIMFLLYLVAYVDRISLGFAQLRMGTELALDPAMFGLAAGIFFAGYILLEVPSGVALDRFGARIWMTRIGVTWGLVTILTGFVQNDVQLIIARFLLGAAEAGLAPGVVLFAMRLFPAAHRAKANAVVFLGSPLAAAVAGPICGVILDHVDWFGLSSWRWIFILTGIPAVLLGILTYRRLTDRPAEATWLTDDQRTWLIDAIAKEPRAAKHSGNALFASLRNPSVVLLGLVQFLIVSGGFGLSYWSPQIVKGLSGEVTATAVGLLVMIPYLLAAAAMYGNGVHSDRTGERTFHASTGPLVSGLALISIPFITDNNVVAFLLLALGTASLNAYAAPFWTISQKLFAGPNAAVAIAMVTTIGNLGGLLAPYIFGLLTGATGSTSAGITYLGCGTLIAAAILVVGRNRWSRGPMAEQPAELAVRAKSPRDLP